MRQRNRPWYFTGLPMIWMLSLTLLAMVKKIVGFYGSGQWLLLGVAETLLLLVIAQQ